MQHTSHRQLYLLQQPVHENDDYVFVSQRWIRQDLSDKTQLLARPLPKQLCQGGASLVKQGTITIHEDGAAYRGSISSLTMEVEAVPRALRWTASRGQ